jgi:hypothetical protein
MRKLERKTELRKLIKKMLGSTGQWDFVRFDHSPGEDVITWDYPYSDKTESSQYVIFSRIEDIAYWRDEATIDQSITRFFLEVEEC